MRKLIFTKNTKIFIIVLVCFSLVLLIKLLLIQYLLDNDHPVIWFTLAIVLTIFFIDQIRKYRALRKRKASIITRRMPELYRLVGVVDDNLFYILNELDTISLPDDLTNEIEVTCRGFQNVLLEVKDRIHILENELLKHDSRRRPAAPAKARKLATTMDSIDNAIVDQLHLMHNLVMKFRKLKDDDENIALASVLLNESGANILIAHEDIKDEFRIISGSIKEVRNDDKPGEGIKDDFRKTSQRVIKVSDREYRLPCSVCGEIAVVFKTGIPKFAERKNLIYTGITHKTGNIGNAERIFEWLEEGRISEVHFHVMEYVTMEEGIDAYCPDCDKIYCWAHYNPREEWEDDWWYDCTYGTCPEGHRRIIHD